MASSPGIEKVGFARKYNGAEKVMRIIHVEKCSKCLAPRSDLFTFDPYDGEFVICPLCLGRTYISEAWLDRFYKVVDFWNGKDDVPQYVNVAISELANVLSCAPAGKHSLLLMDETIHRIGSHFLKDAWERVLQEDVFPKEEPVDDAGMRVDFSDPGFLEAMRQDALHPDDLHE